MFSLIQLKPASGVFDIGASDFARDYPIEGFDIDDPDNSPVESVLYYCCGVIQESRLFEFCLDAGDEYIDLRIKPELSILLAELSKLISLLRGDILEAEVDFYEQAREIIIQFSKSDNSIRIHVESKVDGRTFQRQVSHEEMSASVGRFLLSFLTAVKILTPAILREPAFERWFSEMLLTPAKS